MTENPTNDSPRPNKLPILLTFAVAPAMAALLYAQGRIWWCKLGDGRIYVNEAWQSSHTSQHLFDPYTLTHVLHGVMFFWVAALLLAKLSVGWRLFAATAAEAAWEALENTDAVIEKYRENTASLDYFGDSIFNSLGDLLACVFGFWLAHKLGWRRSILFFLATELILLFWIRDGLLLNILMLLYPLDAIKQWQMGV
jgi:hypothetical protein